ncbi:MAG: type IV pilus assembly protein PilM, partial [Kiritimatiellae bacterium]|nr:type IV pilus assembly protein PilM [Kiritimatiellia bacterium]
MFASDRILALNIGASKLALAEFKVRAGQAPELNQYGVAELGIEPDSETDPSAYIVSAIRDLMRERGIRPAPLLMTLSGQAVFPRFVKLPPVARDKIRQMIEYEAEQNVPFPIGEVVWDHQLIGTADAGEQSVMIVAVKTDNVSELTDCVLAAGLEPEIVDVAPLALYNCARFNYPDLQGCTMVLDIGARSTNLIFIEEGRIFSRSIPVAGNTITQELAKSFQLEFRIAERLKRQHAFVALGGAYAITDDETAERVSKVVRNVVTRLHAEVNRSINFYRSQQGGNVPSRVLLTGGSSIIPHMDTFFREKLRVDVDYLNPFVNVAVGKRADAAKVSEEFYELGEVVGLALRYANHCPIEINLMPPNLVRQKTFRRRIPYFGAAAAAVLLTLLTWSVQGSRQLSLYQRQQQSVAGKLQRLQEGREALDREARERDAVMKVADELRGLIGQRTHAARQLVALRDSLFDGMWLAAIEPVKDEAGNVSRLRIVGRGFSDKLRQVESAESDRGGKATAVELLRDRLKTQALFGEDVTIVDEREDQRY